MSSSRSLKLEQKSLLQQQEVVLELDRLVKDIERCETTIQSLATELQEVNEKHKDRKTTREDIAYLTDLLRCANKKLAWEKQIASLQKRAPGILDRLTTLMNDPVNPPAEEMKAGMLRALQGVQAAMERLQQAKVN